jgi:transcriptional regulator with XRE-family HTH domain
MKRKSSFPFGAALAKVRRALALDQGELAGYIGASRASVSRWESGAFLPMSGYHANILAAVAAAPPELVRELTRTLVGVDPGPPRPPAPVARPEDAVEPRAAMSEVLLDIAEALDVSPRRLRAGLIDALGRIERLGLTPKAAREALALPKKSAKNAS